MTTTSESEACDVLVVGGGILGMATARELALRGLGRVIVLEAESAVATHQSGRNSGVVHAGLYYQPGSQKARLCSEGRRSLYAYCEERDIPFRRSGKLVVATTPGEVAGLDALESRGRANGLLEIQRVTAAEIREREPYAEGLAGLWVPMTGVVDFRRVTHSFARDLESGGGELRTSSRVQRIDSVRGEVVVESTGGTFRGRRLVNCAGLESDRVARLAGLDPDVRILPFRGEYFRLGSSAAHLVRGLVYPVPDPALPFLGVHFTRTVDDEVLVGPNAVPAFSRRGYRRRDVSMTDLAEMLFYRGSWLLLRRFWKTGVGELLRSFSRRSFVASARRLVPSLSDGDLVPAPSGVRAQAVGRDGRLIDDFHFAQSSGTLHVLNAPSPAATSALAIARAIADRIEL